MHAIYFVFLFHGFLCEPVIDIICNISQRSNDGLSLLSLSSVLSSAVAVLSASRIIKHALFQRERYWTLAMSRLKEPQEKLAVTWNVPSTFLSSIKNDTQCLWLDFMSSVATDTFVYCKHSIRLPIVYYITVLIEPYYAWKSVRRLNKH